MLILYKKFNELVIYLLLGLSMLFALVTVSAASDAVVLKLTPGGAAAAQFWNNIGQGVAGVGDGLADGMKAGGDIRRTLNELNQKIKKCGKCAERTELVNRYNRLQFGYDYLVAMQQAAYSSSMGGPVVQNPLLDVISGAAQSAGRQCGRFQKRFANCVSEVVGVANRKRKLFDQKWMITNVAETCGVTYDDYYICRADSENWFISDQFDLINDAIREECENTASEHLISPATTGDIKTVCQCIGEKAKQSSLNQVFIKQLVKQRKSKTFFTPKGMHSYLEEGLAISDQKKHGEELIKNVYACIAPLALTYQFYSAENRIKAYDKRLPRYMPTPGRGTITYADGTLVKSDVRSRYDIMASTRVDNIPMTYVGPYVRMIAKYVPENQAIITCGYQQSGEEKDFTFWHKKSVEKDRELYALLPKENPVKASGKVDGCPATLEEAQRVKIDFIEKTENIDTSEVSKYIYTISTIDWSNYRYINLKNPLDFYTGKVDRKLEKRQKTYTKIERELASFLDKEREDWGWRSWEELVGAAASDYLVKYKNNTLAIARFDPVERRTKTYNITKEYQEIFSRIDADVFVNMKDYAEEIDSHFNENKVGGGVGFIMKYKIDKGKFLEVHVYKANKDNSVTIGKLITPFYLDRSRKLINQARNNAGIELPKMIDSTVSTTNQVAVSESDDNSLSVLREKQSERHSKVDQVQNEKTEEVAKGVRIGVYKGQYRASPKHEDLNALLEVKRQEEGVFFGELVISDGEGWFAKRQKFKAEIRYISLDEISNAVKRKQAEKYAKELSGKMVVVQLKGRSRGIGLASSYFGVLTPLSNFHFSELGYKPSSFYVAYMEEE